MVEFAFALIYRKFLKMVLTRSSKSSSEENSKVYSSKTAEASKVVSSVASTSAARTSARVLPHKISARGKCVKPLYGREREFSEICSWIEKAVTNGCPLSVYISGSPGTGKSETMKLVCQYFGHRVVSTILNCASVHTHLEIVRSILDAVGSSSRPSLPTLSTTLKGLKKHFVLILDEIDHLASKTNSFLYTIFQWPQTITAKLIVIGKKRVSIYLLTHFARFSG